ADLGIDSIQRAELWVGTAEELGIDKEARPNRKISTISDFALALAELKNAPASSETKQDSSDKKKELTSRNSETETPELKKKTWGFYTQNWEFIPAESIEDFDCKSVYAIVDEPRNYSNLRRLLKEKGITVSFRKTETFLKQNIEKNEAKILECDTILYIDHGGVVNSKKENLRDESIRKHTENLFSVFKKLYHFLEKNARRIIIPAVSNHTMDGGSSSKIFSSFPAGFFKSLQRELKNCHFQLIYASPEKWDSVISEHSGIVAKPCEIGFVNGAFATPAVSKIDFPARLYFPVSKDDLILVTGGARGIVFECVLKFAEKTGCKLLLTGRTDLPEKNITDMNLESRESLRKLEMTLAKKEGLSLRKAREKAAYYKKQQEVAKNLHRLENAGCKAEYRVCDVSNSKDFENLLVSLKQKGDLVRGVIHGAGVQRSKQLPDLPEKDALLTVCTKIIPLNTLIKTLDWNNIKMFAAFGSIAGLFGNAGQTDYSLANDLLADTVSRIGCEYPHVKAKTIEWTAWRGTGMVKEEEAERFEAGGLVPVDVENGVQLFIHALCGTEQSRVAVFNTNSDLAETYDILEHTLPAEPGKRLVGKSTKTGKETAEFSLEKDSFLNQHLVNGKPVVPGTFITEIFAESEAFQNRSEICNITFRRPLETKNGKLSVEIVKKGENLLLLPETRPDLPPRALENLNYSKCSVSKAKTVPAELPFKEKYIKILENEAAKEGVPFYKMLDEKFSGALKTGSVFRGICSVTQNKNFYTGLVSLTKDALAAFETPGNFRIHPVLADMAVQVASSWAMTSFDVMAIPFKIDLLSIYEQSGERDYIVVCDSVNMRKEESKFNVAVFEKNGKKLFAFTGLTLKSIAGVE
ncbi:MAG: KR domain-containing protein, partial [bacterium]